MTNPRPEPISRIWLRDPQLALETAFKRSEEAGGFRCRAPTMQVAYQAADGTSYSSYKHVSREDLKGRRYEIECWDYRIGVRFGDVIFDPRTNMVEPGTPPFMFEPPLDRQQLAKFEGVL